MQRRGIQTLFSAAMIIVMFALLVVSMPGWPSRPLFYFRPVI